MLHLRDYLVTQSKEVASAWLAAGYKRLPVLKRRLRLLAYTSVCVLQCIYKKNEIIRTSGWKQTCMLLWQVIVWAVLTVLQTLPFWQTLKPFWPPGRACLLLW